MDVCVPNNYNFLNEDVQAGTKGLKYAAQKGLAVVIMEPLLGGYLAQPPADIQQIWDEAEQNPADMALRWIWNLPEVLVVLSGMRSLEDVQKNLASAEASGVGTLTEDDHAIIARVYEEYQKYSVIPCTKCRYCMPCPQGIDIPRNFELYNGSQVNPYLNKAVYIWHMRESEQAKSCVGCKVCEEKCPQQINISEWMPRIHEAFLKIML